MKNRVFVNQDSRYTNYFPEYAKYFGIALRLLKSMYVMTNYGKLFDDKLTEWLLEAGFIQYKCQMFIYYKYAPDRSKMLQYLMLMTVSKALGKWLVDTLGKRFHMNFLGYTHWFMSIRSSHMKDHSISVNQARYATSIVAEYMVTATVKASTNFNNTTFPSDMISKTKLPVMNKLII